MESAGGKMKINIDYVVQVPIKRIEWYNIQAGWFVQFEGSWESMNFGAHKPDWNVGDIIKITFHKMEPECPVSPNTNPSDSQSSSCSATPNPGRPEAL